MLSRVARPAVRSTAQAVRATQTTPTQTANYATLRDIEGKLKSISNIRKITSTMKIVASTKLTRAQRAMAESRLYGQTSDQVYTSAEAKALETQEKQLWIIASGDKGLCGGVHSGLSRYVRRTFAAMPDHGSSIDLCIIGEKAKAQLARSNAQQIVASFAGIGKDTPTFADASAIADQIFQLGKDYSSIKILYNKFVNAQSYEPTLLDTYSEQALQESAGFAQFEVDESILSNLKEYSLANTIYAAMAEGYAAEVSARRNAMDNASKNAGDMIGRLQIQFNRTRQAAITNELCEIIAGASASEDV